MPYMPYCYHSPFVQIVPHYKDRFGILVLRILACAAIISSFFTKQVSLMTSSAARMPTILSADLEDCTQTFAINADGHVSQAIICTPDFPNDTHVATQGTLYEL